MRKNPVRTKLRSQEGASILFALFFFIVCAVIGSIVLTAATAAAGRVKDVKDNNKRYYAVNSAVELLESVLNNPATKVELSKTWMGTETYVDYNFIDCTPNTRDNYWKDPEVTGQGLAKALYDKASGELQLNHGGGDQLSVLIHSITASGGEENCDRKVQICSTDGQYSLILNCVAHVDKRVDVKYLGTKVKSEGEKRIDEKNIQETTTKTVTWTVTAVTKGGPVK